MTRHTFVDAVVNTRYEEALIECYDDQRQVIEQQDQDIVTLKANYHERIKEWQAAEATIEEQAATIRTLREALQHLCDSMNGLPVPQEYNEAQRVLEETGGYGH